jgi:hypothetical protein
MLVCHNCKIHFPIHVKIDGRDRNLSHRKFCLDCSPFDQHNTKDITKLVKEQAGLSTCARCGEDKPVSEFYKHRNRHAHPYCKKCNGIKVLERQRKLKEDAVVYKGGECAECGYKRCLAALEFHHLDPKHKDFSISKKRHTTLEKIKPELDKCVLLCAVCHREVHDGIRVLKSLGAIAA